MALSNLSAANAGTSAHPNDLNRRWIERALQSRKRYRYVSPSVRPADGGYRIESPCCSRNVDAEGGVVDIAFLEFCAETGSWRLYHKDHARAAWTLEGAYPRLVEALDHLNADPARKFWQ
jgi:hypothetical protein